MRCHFMANRAGASVRSTLWAALVLKIAAALLRVCSAAGGWSIY
jgi:hypothetical protein